MILTFFHSLLLGMAFINPLLVELLAGYSNCLDTSSTDETLRPFSSINNHDDEDGMSNDLGLQHLESSMLNPDKQKENDKHGQGGKSQHEVIRMMVQVFQLTVSTLLNWNTMYPSKTRRTRENEMRKK